MNRYQVRKAAEKIRKDILGRQGLRFQWGELDDEILEEWTDIIECVDGEAWEYNIIYLEPKSEGSIFPEIVERLNLESTKGWELVGVTSAWCNDHWFSLFMKRRVKQAT